MRLQPFLLVLMASIGLTCSSTTPGTSPLDLTGGDPGFGTDLVMDERSETWEGDLPGDPEDLPTDPGRPPSDPGSPPTDETARDKKPSAGTPLSALWVTSAWMGPACRAA